MPALLLSLSAFVTGYRVLTVVFLLAALIVLAVFLFSVIPTIARDQRADAKSARGGLKRAATVPLKKVSS